MSTLPNLLAGGLLVVAALVALVRPAWLLPLEGLLRAALRRPRRPGWWALAGATAALLAQAATGLIVGLPEARIHDEFSMLLQGETYLQGRLANPTPPSWRHFETFHILMRPTYAAKYPPALGAVLAVGELLGHAIFGAWLAGAALVGSAAWMLSAWLRPPWARLATLLIAANVVVATLWSLGYRGAFVAAAAGALLFGAAERLRARPRASLGALLGAAIAVLAMSRPYEGFVVTVAVMMSLIGPARRSGWRRAALLRAAPACALTLACGLGWLAFYNYRVTGSPLRLPFLAYDELHARVPLFLWQELNDPPPANPRMDGFYRDFESEAWREQHTPGGWLAAAARKTGMSLDFYLRPPFVVALLALPWTLRGGPPRVRRAAWMLAALLGSQLLILPGQPHYVAPGACLLAYLAVECWRRLRLPWLLRGRAADTRVRRAFAATLPLVVLVVMVHRAVELRAPIEEWPRHRAAVRRQLAALPGRDLVVVHYDPRLSPHVEFVFNGADLAGAPVLWARALSPAQDCALVRSLPDRRPWTLEVIDDLSPPRLATYPPAACSGAPDAAPNRTRRPSTRHGSVSSRRSASG